MQIIFKLSNKQFQQKTRFYIKEYDFIISNALNCVHYDFFS